MANPAPPETFRRAVAAYQGGDLVKAEKLCKATLKSRPEYFDALHLLAVTQSRRGFPAEALAAFDKALGLLPKHPDLLNNRGSALSELKRHDEALVSFDEALTLRPNHAEARKNRGCVLMELGRYADALVDYGKALVLAPGNVEYINNLGRALTSLRRFDDALSCFDDALALKPDYFDALVNRGVALKNLVRRGEAISCYDTALALRPDSIETLLNRADALNSLKRYEEALQSYDRAMELGADRTLLLIARGTALSKLDRFDEALQCLDEALARSSDSTEALISRCLAFLAAERPDEALADIEQALKLSPQRAEAHNARGLVLMDMERFAESKASFRRTLELQSDFHLAGWNLGYLELLAGDFVEGWKNYESRRWREETQWTKLNGPEWRGEPIARKTLLLYAEQGFGDTIQFARFVRLAAERDAKVILGVYEPLAALLSSAEGNPIITLHGERTPKYDLHLPLMSVPYVLGMDEASIASAAPYLNAEPARVAAWKTRLPQAKFRVGIAWQGSAAISGRAIPLRTFEAMSEIPGVALVSLQKSDGLDQLAELPPDMNVETLGPDFDASPDAFLDTAAVMMSLDLIVTCDTAIAHLAGGLGCPVWVVLKRVPDWRWMMERPDSPWYPTARLFRCKRNGQWEEPMEEIARALADLVSVQGLK